MTVPFYVFVLKSVILLYRTCTDYCAESAEDDLFSSDEESEEDHSSDSEVEELLMDEVLLEEGESEPLEDDIGDLSDVENSAHSTQ